jgi:hypothetical protein
LNFKCRSFSEFSFKIHFEFEEVSMEKAVPLFKPNKPYFISVFLSKESPFWISQNLKEFKFHLNLFEFEFFNPIITAVRYCSMGPICQLPRPLPCSGDSAPPLTPGCCRLPTATCLRPPPLVAVWRPSPPAPLLCLPPLCRYKRGRRCCHPPLFLVPLLSLL